MSDCILTLRSKRFSDKRTISVFLFATGIISLTLNSSPVQAQSTQPSAADNVSPRQLDNIQPFQQNFNYNSGGSQQFFQEGNDRLYFLPEEKSEPILQIDQTIEAEGINYEDLQQKPSEE